MSRSRLLPLAAATGAIALALTAGPALAANTYTSKAGTTTSGTTTYTASTQGASPQVKFRDVTTGLNLSCLSSAANGSIKLGAAVPGAKIGTITGTTWTGCKGPLNLDMTVAQTGTWALNATGVTTAAGVTKGTVTNVNARVSANQGGCAFTVTGKVIASVKTAGATQTLSLLTQNPQLKVSNVAGCFGQVNNNDTASIAAVYGISAAKGQYSLKSN